MLVVSYSAVACPHAGAPSPTELGGNDMGGAFPDDFLFALTGANRVYFARTSKTLPVLDSRNSHAVEQIFFSHRRLDKKIATGCISFAPSKFGGNDVGGCLVRRLPVRAQGRQMRA